MVISITYMINHGYDQYPTLINQVINQWSTIQVIVGRLTILACDLIPPQSAWLTTSWGSSARSYGKRTERPGRWATGRFTVDESGQFSDQSLLGFRPGFFVSGLAFMQSSFALVGHIKESGIRRIVVNYANFTQSTHIGHINRSSECCAVLDSASANRLAAIDCWWLVDNICSNRTQRWVECRVNATGCCRML